MNQDILTLDAIQDVVEPLAEKYHLKELYLFGSYARGAATSESDLDFLAYGGENFKPVSIFALNEELFEIFRKNVHVYEIREINEGSGLYYAIMRDRLRLV